MADAPSPLPTRGVLDLSTGPAAPPPPPPAPRPPVTPDPDVKVGKVLDLSKRPAVPGPPPARDVFGSGPVIRETIDLSTNAPPAPEPSETSAKPAKVGPDQKRDRSGSGRSGPPHRPDSQTRSEPPNRSEPSGRSKPQRGVAPKSASSSLADLLDPDVLARLRGEG